jgi:3-oxoacyl-[acyl-carrier-protein] synthase II
MKVYIKGMGNISPQKTWDDSELLTQPLDYATNRLTCIEPDYSSFIDPKQIRRMSRIIKMGIASASMAMKEAGITMPDAIITGTGYGCLEDTGIFLNKMIANKEEALNPTPFIQSTHNTIGSQIALLLQCQYYNQTYTHGACSFESALLDAMLQLQDNPERSLLVGGIEEITDTSHQIQARFGIFRENVKSTLKLLEESNAGTVNGEGSAFFLLSGTNETNAIACIKGLTTFYKPDQVTLHHGIERFLETVSTPAGEVDLILMGKSGEQKQDDLIGALAMNIFPDSKYAVYKNLCGEYPVASAFALWLAARMLKFNDVPKILLEKDTLRPVKNILIFNQYFGTHYSLILVSAC